MFGPFTFLGSTGRTLSEIPTAVNFSTAYLCLAWLPRTEYRLQYKWAGSRYKTSSKRSCFNGRFLVICVTCFIAEAAHPCSTPELPLSPHHEMTYCLLDCDVVLCLTMRDCLEVPMAVTSDAQLSAGTSWPLCFTILAWRKGQIRPTTLSFFIFDCGLICRLVASLSVGNPGRPGIGTRVVLTGSALIHIFLEVFFILSTCRTQAEYLLPPFSRINLIYNYDVQFS